MITDSVRSKVDQIWDTFWTGGISNPISVIEQMTYLLFIKGLDEAQTRKEKQARLLGKPVAEPVFPEGDFPSEIRPPVPYQDLRWSRFKNLEARAMYERIAYDVFPFVKTIQKEDTAFAIHMRDAIFLIPPEKAGLLAKVVDMLDGIPMENRDMKGDLYEYMLGKLSSAGDNGQFRTPRHIIQLMTEIVAPRPEDVICDPACGTAGFLVAVSEYFHHPDRLGLFSDKKFRTHFHQGMFHGFDFDSTMLRIGSMNLLLHGVDNPAIVNRDSLSEDHAGEEDKYSVILANPPFAGSLDYEACAKDLLQIVKTKKTELLFLALFLRLLRPGGRAAVIVPEGVLFGSSKAHKELRRLLVEQHKLDAVIKLPSGVFRPYAGVSTAILIFTKTNSGGTDLVWFYDLQADGRSLDDKRSPLVPDEKFGPLPAEPLSPADHAKNNLPDVLARWRQFHGAGSASEDYVSPERVARMEYADVLHPNDALPIAAEDSPQYRTGERARARTDQSFCVPKNEIAAQAYDLSLNRYKEVIHEDVAHRPPQEILAELANLEAEIQRGMKELEGMLK